MQKTYYAVLVSYPNEDGYLVKFPEVQHCFSDGKTVEDAIERAHEALELHLKNWQQPLPPHIAYADLKIDIDKNIGERIETIVPITVSVKGRKKRYNFTLDEQLISAVERVTDNKSAFIEHAIADKLSSYRLSK